MAQAEARVTLYFSSVAGNLPSKKSSDSIRNLLTAHRIPFNAIDVSQPDNSAQKDYMHQKSGKADLPQVFVDGEYKGAWSELEMANEDGLLRQFLGL
eukprot:TRINITY_DN2189_c0_g1_i3.p1 TRINITY_DN2189_c0_g1~~TRINITY_DN2189_c0_g1_i3.p1  ORF type:complete len:113 (+),score=48.55 TRINITY_DN2189_c0_g1_i3:50-340(+)